MKGNQSTTYAKNTQNNHVPDMEVQDHMIFYNPFNPMTAKEVVAKKRHSKRNVFLLFTPQALAPGELQGHTACC